MSAAQGRQSRLIVVCDTAKVRAMAVNASSAAPCNCLALLIAGSASAAWPKPATTRCRLRRPRTSWVRGYRLPLHLRPKHLDRPGYFVGFGRGIETAPALGGELRPLVSELRLGGLTWGVGSTSRGSCTRVEESNLLIHELFRPFGENC
jgi:hypothetical protein